jgi:hypothetical protein
METISLPQIPTADMEYYFNRLMPRNFPTANPQDKYDVAIEQRHVYIYGKQGKGKTNVTKLLVNRAAELYGECNLSVQRANAEHFGRILTAQWEKKPIQIVILEDASDVEIPKYMLASFFRIRHIMFKKTGLREGLVIVIFCCHRLHETPIALRSDYDSLLILGAPMNDWDVNFVESKVGEKSANLLEDAEERGEKGNVLVTYRRKFLGLWKIPKLMFNIPIRDMEELMQAEEQAFAEQSEWEEEESFSLKKLVVTRIIKRPRLESILFALLLIEPWLASYAVSRNTTLQTAMSAISCSLLLSGAYLWIRFEKWRMTSKK